MQGFSKRFYAGIMAVVLLVCLLPVSALALTKQEQEDIYRVDTLWQEEDNQKYINWLLDSDNFLYHLDITTGNIIHDLSYENINLNALERKDNFVQILSAIIDYSFESVREEAAQESANKLTVYFFESFEEYMLEQPAVATETVEIICDATNLATMHFLDKHYLLDSCEIQLSYDEMLEYINLNIADGNLPEGATAYFEAFTTSSEWLEKWKAYSTMFSVVGETINILTDSLDIAVELESYKKADDKFVALLKYIHSKTTDPALKAACAEVYTRLSNSFEDNFVAEVVKRLGEAATNLTIDAVIDCLAESSIVVRGIVLGYKAGTLASNLFFNTDDTKKYMQSIYCLNELSEIVVPLLRNELSNLHYYDSLGKFSARYAADTIYHMRVLICLRQLGEESYYNLKDGVYGSFVVRAANLLPWVSTEETENTIEAWHGQFWVYIIQAKNSLYESIPEDSYYKELELAEFEKEGTTLVSYNGDSAYVNIPTDVYYNTIGSYAFNGNEAVRCINIPNTITAINANAFYNCTNLQSVTINSTYVIIADGAFVNCHEDLTIYGYHNSTAQAYAAANGIRFVALDNEYENAQGYVDSDFAITDGVLTGYFGYEDRVVYVPYGVTAIGDFAFQYSGIKDVVIPDSVTTIGEGAFLGCDSLISITIPDSVTSIGRIAFCECFRLTSITIPDGVTSIGDHTFTDCRSLISVTIPGSVTSIGDGAFDDCDSLVGITIPNGVTTIEDETFYGCDSLASVAIPDSVTSIGDRAFWDCDSLTDVTIPDGVTNIGSRVFYNSESLVSITIGKSVTSIGEGAFFECVNLTGIWVDENNPVYSSDSKGVLFNKDKTRLIAAPGGLKRYTIPNSVITIGDRAFYYCPSLSSITIPDGVISIGDRAFDNSGLIYIYIHNSVTCIGNNAFLDCSRLDTVYYRGTESQKAEIAIGEGNEDLLDATWHFCKHTDTEVIQEAIGATCTTAGSTAGVKCSVCGEIITAATEIPALGHTPTTAVEEIRNGKTYLVVYCGVCDAEISATEKPVTVVAPELTIGADGKVAIENAFNRIIVFYVGDDDSFAGQANPNWNNLVAAGKKFVAENGKNGYKVYQADNELPALTLAGNYAISVKYTVDGVEKTKWFTPTVDGEVYFTPKITVGEDGKLNVDVHSADTFKRVIVFYLGDDASFAGQANPNWNNLVVAGKKFVAENGKNGYMVYQASTELPKLIWTGNYAISVKYTVDGVEKTKWFTPFIEGEAYHAPVITVDENGKVNVQVHGADTFERVLLFYIGDYEPTKDLTLGSGWNEVLAKGKEYTDINGAAGYKVYSAGTEMPTLDDPSQYAILVKYTGSDGVLRTAAMVP